MTLVQVFVAPAAGGKTEYVVDIVRKTARDLRTTPRVVVPTQLQAHSWRRRLADAGGAIGVRVLTFDRLYAECLGAAGEAYTELSEPVQYRLIRAAVDELPLEHYAPLKDSPGFIQVLQGLIAELKAARIWPEDFARAVSALTGDQPASILGSPLGDCAALMAPPARLLELASLYNTYQQRLRDQSWADRAGLAWLAVEALEERRKAVARDWSLVAVDGFDNFTQVQLELLGVLAGRVAHLVVTLTGDVLDEPRPLVHRRFEKTRKRLEATLNVRAEPLPERVQRAEPVLVHLERNLFRGAQAAQAPPDGAIAFIEAPDRAAEVRAALRWLKARIVSDGARPGEVALLARSVAPYRPYISQTAEEFGLPFRLVNGLPLRANPAVAALLDLLRLVLPREDGAGGPALPRRPVVEAWRSPYFDWSALPETTTDADGAVAIGIQPEDANALDATARQGRVIGGIEQWQEALHHIAQRADADVRAAEDGNGFGDAELDLQPGLAQQDALELVGKFDRFVRRLTPPPGERPYRDWVRWLEDLIGPDPASASEQYPLPAEPTSLGVVARARAGAEYMAERDVAALQALKDVLRGLVWAEEALDTGQVVAYSRFFEELVGAIDAATYRSPVWPDREEILVADVVQARGVPFRTVAVLGMAEGEFPAVLGEDPFLRDADRQLLREHFGLALDPSTESAEAEFFYETVARPWERLLLTRPRLADNGAVWQPSPYWEEVRRLVGGKTETLTSESVPMPADVASWPELMESLAGHPGSDEPRDWARSAEPARYAAWAEAAQLFGLRAGSFSGVALADVPFVMAHDGDLTALAGHFHERFGRDHTWSASRLEAYRTCPFFFFVGHALGLEPREEPAEGLDARQMGTIYHRILEEVYQSPDVMDPGEVTELLRALPAVAERVLDAAPESEGFRETAWWTHTRAEIVENVRRSLIELAEIQGDFVPHRHEAVFGLHDQPRLVLRDGEDRLYLRGFIDRVDRAPDGRLRIIDYKTAAPYAYTPKTLREGEKLQLPLYALGARDALGLGDPSEGFYWHVRHARASSLTLAKFGPEEAMRTAAQYAWETVRAVRGGHFVPRSPDAGCPSYCPAASMCWQYVPGYGG